jgi:DNA-binding LacI/PurR family transcriptional regulator
MPLAELGGAAVDALITRIEGEPAGDVMVPSPMSLVLRHSVSRAGGG